MENSVQLCKKCLNDKKYTIPLITIQEKIIIYKCPIHNTLSKESDIIEKSLNEDIKEKLTICELHYYPLSAWCSKCRKNKCHFCIARQNPKHDYTLFSTYMLGILQNKEIINNKISSMNLILKKEINYIK